jgi:uncharacterized protein (TIGR02118 family)
MHKIIVLYPHPQDEAKFRAYYATGHIPLAKKLPGLLACRYSMGIEGLGVASPYFCIFEADFADAAAMGAALNSDAGKALGPDMANYVTTPPILLHYEVE